MQCASTILDTANGLRCMGQPMGLTVFKMLGILELVINCWGLYLILLLYLSDSRSRARDCPTLNCWPHTNHLWSIKLSLTRCSNTPPLEVIICQWTVHSCDCDRTNISSDKCCLPDVTTQMDDLFSDEDRLLHPQEVHSTIQIQKAFLSKAMNQVKFLVNQALKTYSP